MLGVTEQNFSLYIQRRQQLLRSVKEKGSILLFAGLEQEAVSFVQESSFYYLTGLQEPGVVLLFDEQKTTLFIPNSTSRKQWCHNAITITDSLKQLGIDEVRYLGDAIPGYQLYPFTSLAAYRLLISELFSITKQNNYIYTLLPDNNDEYVQQRFLWLRFLLYHPELQEFAKDISAPVADMRRKKDLREIELIYKAIEITALAQEAAAQTIDPKVNEQEVQASLEYMITGSGARIAFPSIVASGINSTTLHYNENQRVMKKDELIVIDIGAKYQGYCADITRTYPVSGTYSKRQKEIYSIVLEAQEYIASLAKPGLWLNNKEKPQQSLNHLVIEFLDKKGYKDYFIHGIGHFLGLDVHDVGDYKKPLEEGDVFTIEPGIYIPKEALGVRIEDNYWIVKDGAECLSDFIPKTIAQIEEFMLSKKHISNDK